MARVKSSVAAAALAGLGLGLGGCESFDEFVDGVNAFATSLTDVNNSLSAMDGAPGAPVGQITPTTGVAQGSNMPVFKDTNGSLFIPDGAGGWSSYAGVIVDANGNVLDPSGL